MSYSALSPIRLPSEASTALNAVSDKLKLLNGTDIMDDRIFVTVQSLQITSVLQVRPPWITISIGKLCLSDVISKCDHLIPCQGFLALLDSISSATEKLSSSDLQSTHAYLNGFNGVRYARLVSHANITSIVGLHSPPCRQLHIQVIQLTLSAGWRPEERLSCS